MPESRGLDSSHSPLQVSSGHGLGGYDERRRRIPMLCPVYRVSPSLLVLVSRSRALSDLIQSCTEERHYEVRIAYWTSSPGVVKNVRSRHSVWNGPAQRWLLPRGSCILVPNAEVKVSICCGCFRPGSRSKAKQRGGHPISLLNADISYVFYVTTSKPYCEWKSGQISITRIRNFENSVAAGKHRSPKHLRYIACVLFLLCNPSSIYLVGLAVCPGTPGR